MNKAANILENDRKPIAPVSAIRDPAPLSLNIIPFFAYSKVPSPMPVTGYSSQISKVLMIVVFLVKKDSPAIPSVLWGLIIPLNLVPNKSKTLVPKFFSTTKSAAIRMTADIIMTGIAYKILFENLNNCVEAIIRITPNRPVIEKVNSRAIKLRIRINKVRNLLLKKGLVPLKYGAIIKAIMNVLKPAKPDGSVKMEVALKKFPNFRLSCDTSD
jgi:hypothetical protein